MSHVVVSNLAYAHPGGDLLFAARLAKRLTPGYGAVDSAEFLWMRTRLVVEHRAGLGQGAVDEEGVDRRAGGAGVQVGRCARRRGG